MTAARRHPRSPARALCALALAWGSTACGDSPTQADGALTRSGVESLVESLHATRAFLPGLEEAENPWNCPLSGTVAWQAWYGYVDTGLSLGMERRYQGCAAPDASGTRFDIDGVLLSETVFHTDAFGRFLGTWAGTITGTIQWSFSGGQGSCDLELNVSSSDASGRVSGSLCGMSVDKLLD